MASQERPEKFDDDAWIDAELERAIARADDPNTQWLSHEEVQERMRRQRDSLVARINARNAQKP